MTIFYNSIIIYIFSRLFVKNSYCINQRGLLAKTFLKRLIVNPKWSEVYYNETGLYINIHKQTIDYTEEYFLKHEIESNKLYLLCNKHFNTNKFTNYFKQSIAARVFPLLELLEFSAREAKLISIFLERDELSEFIYNRWITDRGATTHNINIKIQYLPKARALSFLAKALATFVLSLTNLFKGIYNRQKINKYLFSKELADGLSPDTVLSDLLFFQGKQIRLQDVIFYTFGGTCLSQKIRNKAWQDSKRNNQITSVNLQKLRFNIYNRVVLRKYFKLFYFLLPKTFLIAFKSKLSLELGLSLIDLYLHSFKWFSLLSNNTVSANISIYDANNISETIIVNYLDCSNILYHWSDLTAYDSYQTHYNSVNYYYYWGDHSLMYAKHYQIENKIMTGFLSALYIKKWSDQIDSVLQQLKINKLKPVVVLYDSSYSNNFFQTEDKYKEIYKSIFKIADEFNDKYTVILKAKNVIAENSILSNLFCELGSESKLIIVDPLMNYSIEKIIALSDFNIVFGSYSPAVFSWLSSKPAIVYDMSGNKNNPIQKKYLNSLVFETLDEMIDGVKKVLNSGDYSKLIADESDSKSYDFYRDDKAIERTVDDMVKNIKVLKEVCSDL